MSRSCPSASGLSRRPIFRNGSWRSEEHTSELQSHLNLVCRLLLEKKKKNIYNVKLCQCQGIQIRARTCLSAARYSSLRVDFVCSELTHPHLLKICIPKHAPL